MNREIDELRAALAECRAVAPDDANTWRHSIRLRRACDEVLAVLAVPVAQVLPVVHKFGDDGKADCGSLVTSGPIDGRVTCIECLHLMLADPQKQLEASKAEGEGLRIVAEAAAAERLSMRQAAASLNAEAAALRGDLARVTEERDVLARDFQTETGFAIRLQDEIAELRTTLRVLSRELTRGDRDG